MQRSWDEWIRGYGAKLEARLEKIRWDRLLKHPFGWIARDSTVLLTIAAGLIGTVIVVAVTRLAGSKPIGQRRILFASVAYSVGFAATYTGGALRSRTSCGSSRASAGAEYDRPQVLRRYRRRLAPRGLRGRLYQLVRQHDTIHDRTLEITFLESGTEAYVLTFG